MRIYTKSQTRTLRQEMSTMDNTLRKLPTPTSSSRPPLPTTMELPLGEPLSRRPKVAFSSRPPLPTPVELPVDQPLKRIHQYWTPRRSKSLQHNCLVPSSDRHINYTRDRTLSNTTTGSPPKTVTSLPHQTELP